VIRIARTKFNVDKDTEKRTWDGIVFDSVLEMKFYRDVLCPLVKSGDVVQFELQKPYELQPKFSHNGKTVKAITYVADFFIVYNDGTSVVIDTKGCPDSTIEVVSNDGGAPDWHVSDSVLERLIELCTDICRRNGIVALNYTGNKNGNLTMHKWFAATACPGPYLESKFPYIASEVNKRLQKADTSANVQKVPAGKVSFCILSGTDVGRGADKLIRYTKGRTGTNRYGWEVCIVDGVATSDAIYGNGNIWVGEGTYVLSGHGEAGRWLYAHVKKGTRVDVDTKFGFVRVR